MSKKYFEQFGYEDEFDKIFKDTVNFIIFVLYLPIYIFLVIPTKIVIKLIRRLK